MPTPDDSDDVPAGDPGAPLLSVVICTYNRSALLPTAVCSVLGQSLRDLELVVVDDGSTDDTRRVVTEIDDERVRYVYRPNGGLSAARNTGAHEARGRFVVFLDDDDRFVPTALQTVASALAAGDHSVATWAAEAVDEAGNRVETIVPRDLGPAFQHYRALFQAGTFAIERELYLRVGGFDEGLRTSHQTEFALRVLPICRADGLGVVTLDDLLTVIVYRGAQRRERNDPERLLGATLRILERHRAQLERSPRVLADYLATAGVAAARVGDLATSRRLFIGAARATPDWSQRGRNAVRAAVTVVAPLARRTWPADYGASRTPGVTDGG